MTRRFRGSVAIDADNSGGRLFFDLLEPRRMARMVLFSTSMKASTVDIHYALPWWKRLLRKGSDCDQFGRCECPARWLKDEFVWSQHPYPIEAIHSRLEAALDEEVT